MELFHKNIYRQIINWPFKYHVIAGIIIRLVLIFYGDLHDQLFDVQYTDVDYKVFTDAARHVVVGRSPYKRHTYRYSPILAYLMIPNIILWKNFGKCLFSVFDILIAVAVKKLVEFQLYNKKSSNIPTICSLVWLYNPLSICISTRGNADSVPCFFIIMSLMFLQTDVIKGLSKYLISGTFLGISIHLRLYPLAFSFPMYISLYDNKITRNTNFLQGVLALLPNKKQIILALSCILTLILLTYGMYLLYEYEFLFETYIYHLIRKDTRHNFSVLFYYSYLTSDHLAVDIVKIISQIFEFLILFVISLTFGYEAKTLSFALFCQAFVLVAFNSVMTSQYFVWFLSLLPLVIHNLMILPSKAIVLASIWVASQAAWLFYAYLLEFHCKEVFIFIWLKSVVFFCINNYILCKLIKNYRPKYCFGMAQICNEQKTK